MARLVPAALILVAVAALAISVDTSTGQERDATTTLLSRSVDGGTPNGPSTNAVISGDLRYAELVAFESEASDLVKGDTNGLKDVFAIRRAGTFGNKGTPWKAGPIQRVSRGLRGKQANGPSFAPAVNGDFRNRGSCVAFLSDASNLVSGDTNGVTDAFLSKETKFTPTRVSLPGDKQSKSDTTAVAVSGDCSRVAFITGGKLFIRAGGDTTQLKTNGTPSDPSFATGTRGSDLVFAAKKGAWLSREAEETPKLIASKGKNPAFGSVPKREVVAYERTIGGHVQIAARDLGKGERVISKFGNELGNAGSRHPTVVNSGFFVGFESDASNLGTSASGRQEDANGLTDAYLFTEVRDVTLLESLDDDSDPLPGGGSRPSTSFYRNYVIFHSPGADPSAPPQIFFRYLGGI